MTILADRPSVFAESPEPEPEHEHGPSGFLKWITSTDHKVIGKSYTITAVIFFLLAGCMAMLIRAQLASPDSTLLSQHTYNEMFTMHGSLMIYLFVGPVAFGGLANYIVPLQIGAPDMAFPRLNALSYWLYLGGGSLMMMGFLTTGSAADFGWVAYAPLSNSINTPGAGPDLWIVALILTGFSAIFTGVNLVSTIYYLRAPGMTMFRMPIFTWNMLVTGILILIAFPVFTSALVLLWCDRNLGAHIFEVSGGGVPVLWQDLFWFFGHPEVYILALPFFGIVTDVISVFSRKPIFGYRGMVFATISIAALSTSVWAHHMFTTGVVLLPFFSLMSYLIAVPTGIKFFNWIGTMWRGSVKFDTPMLFAVGFLATFLIGGVTGILLASPPIDFATHDTYFVVAHFHSVVMALVMGAFAGFFFWYPKITGRMLREGLGKAIVLVHVHRHECDLRPPVPARAERDAEARRGVRRVRRVHDLEPDLERRRGTAVHLRGSLFGQPRGVVATADPRRRQPVGRLHPRVGDDLAASAPQFPEDPADPVRAPGLGLQPSRAQDSRPRPTQVCEARGLERRRHRSRSMKPVSMVATASEHEDPGR